jgi:hypothetical protein
MRGTPEYDGSEDLAGAGPYWQEEITTWQFKNMIENAERGRLGCHDMGFGVRYHLITFSSASDPGMSVS